MLLIPIRSKDEAQPLNVQTLQEIVVKKWRNLPGENETDATMLAASAGGFGTGVTFIQFKVNME